LQYKCQQESSHQSRHGQPGGFAAVRVMLFAVYDLIFSTLSLAASVIGTFYFRIKEGSQLFKLFKSDPKALWA